MTIKKFFCFKDKNHKSKKIYKKHKAITTILKSFDTFVIFGTTSSSIKLSLTEFGLLVIPISSSIACGLTIINKTKFEIVMQKYIKNKEQNEKDQQTIKSFDKLSKKSLQDNFLDKTEYEPQCNIVTAYIYERRKNESIFIKMNIKKISSNIKLKFNLEPTT